MIIIVFMVILTLLTATFLNLFSTTALMAELVEIQLLDKLDETRSYCIDIKRLQRARKSSPWTASTYVLLIPRQAWR